MFKINLFSEIETHLAFTIILILSFLVGWYTISVSENIVEMAKTSPAFNLEAREKFLMRNRELKTSPPPVQPKNKINK